MSLGILCIVSVWHAIVTLVPVYSLPDPSLPNYHHGDWSLATLFPTTFGGDPLTLGSEQNSNTAIPAGMSQLLDLFGQLPLLNVSLRATGDNPRVNASSN